MTTTAAPTASPPRIRRAAIVTPVQQDKLSVLLYGPPKTGKSTAAASAPGPILYLNTEAPTALRFPRARFGSDKIQEIRFEGKRTFDDIASDIRGGIPEKTIVIDSIGQIYQALVEEISADGRITLPQRGDINTLILRFCRFLVITCPQNVVLVCHEDINEAGDDRLLLPRTGGKQLPQPLSAMVDVIGYTKVVRDDKDNEHYVIQTQSDERHYAGNRDGVLGNAAHPDITDWCKRYSAVAKPKEKK